MLRYGLYGGAAGAALWVIYFVALPCDEFCRADNGRWERVIVLPGFVGLGAAVGAVVGLLRDGNRRS